MPRTDVVDGFRAIAALQVFAYHTWLFSWADPQLRIAGLTLPTDVLVHTGYLGVSLFFVISGFCLCLPYAEESLTGKRAPTIRDFWYRRFLKIVPSYGIMLVCTIVAALPAFKTQSDLPRAILMHVVFLQNFGAQFGYSNSVLWSLAIEVQFYVLFPLVIFAFRRNPIVTALGMAGIALAYRVGHQSCCLTQENVMRQLPAYLDLFAAGMLSAWGLTALRRRFRGQRLWLTCGTFLSVALLCATMALLTSADALTWVSGGKEKWDIWMRTLLAADLGALVTATCFAFPAWRLLFANPLLTGLAAVSYNWYLWHTFVELWMLHHGIPGPPALREAGNAAWIRAFLIEATLATACVSTALTYFVERPILSLARPHAFAFPWRGVALREA